MVTQIRLPDGAIYIDSNSNKLVDKGDKVRVVGKTLSVDAYLQRMDTTGLGNHPYVRNRFKRYQELAYKPFGKAYKPLRIKTLAAYVGRMRMCQIVRKAPPAKERIPAGGTGSVPAYKFLLKAYPSLKPYVAEYQRYRKAYDAQAERIPFRKAQKMLRGELKWPTPPRFTHKAKLGNEMILLYAKVMNLRFAMQNRYRPNSSLSFTGNLGCVLDQKFVQWDIDRLRTLVGKNPPRSVKNFLHRMQAEVNNVARSNPFSGLAEGLKGVPGWGILFRFR